MTIEPVQRSRRNTHTCVPPELMDQRRVTARVVAIRAAPIRMAAELDRRIGFQSIDPVQHTMTHQPRQRGLADPLGHQPLLVLRIGDLEFFDGLRDGLLGVRPEYRPRGVDSIRVIHHSAIVRSGVRRIIPRPQPAFSPRYVGCKIRKCLLM